MQRQEAARHCRACRGNLAALDTVVVADVGEIPATRRPLHNPFPPPAGGGAEGGGGPVPPSPICYPRRRDPLSRFATAPPRRGSKLIKGLRQAETFAKPLNRPRLRAGACSFPGFLATPCLSPVSGQPGFFRAAWAMPKRVPARGGDGKLSYSKVSDKRGYDAYFGGDSPDVKRP